MESQHPSLDPAAYEVLLEVARQPESALLRVPLGKGRRGIESLLPVEPLRSTAALLSSAERELLDVHREEVAAWLRRAAFSELFSEDREAGFMERELDRDRRIDLPGRAFLDQECQYLLATGSLAGGEADSARLLLQWTRGIKGKRPDPWGLMRSSLLLQPHPMPVQWLAGKALMSSYRLTAERWISGLQDLEERVPDTPSRRATLELFGSLAAAKADWALAASVYARACESRFATRFTALSYLLNSLQSGDSGHARVANECWDSFGPPRAEDHEVATRSLGVALHSFSWQPTESAKVRFERIESSARDLLMPWIRGHSR